MCEIEIIPHTGKSSVLNYEKSPGSQTTFNTAGIKIRSNLKHLQHARKVSKAKVVNRVGPGTR